LSRRCKTLCTIMFGNPQGVPKHITISPIRTKQSLRAGY